MSITLVVVLVLGTLSVVGINAYVLSRGRALMVPAPDARPADAIMVLGALVDRNQVSSVLADRLETAYALYKRGCAPRLLLTGDHGREHYDEVNTMREYLLKKGARAEDLFMDHAGFNTYNSMYRARDVFKVRRMIVVTQAFHLPRALYLASRLGLDVQGVSADRHHYHGLPQDDVRETGARVKAFLNVNLSARPVFLGPEIPITGDGRATWDKKS